MPKRLAWWARNLQAIRDETINSVLLAVGYSSKTAAKIRIAMGLGRGRQALYSPRSASASLSASSSSVWAATTWTADPLREQATQAAPCSISQRGLYCRIRALNFALLSSTCSS